MDAARAKALVEQSPELLVVLDAGDRVVSAFAERLEAKKGMLVPGQLADLAVLSQDVFTIPAQALPATRSVLTEVVTLRNGAP